MNKRYMNFLNQVVDEDILELREKEKTYQGSWKKRGGVGAAMMMLRKIDRLEIMLKEVNYDIFAALLKDLSGKDGSALAEVRDLRRYLLLIEAEIIALNDEGLFRKRPEPNYPGTPEDGGHYGGHYDCNYNDC